MIVRASRRDVLRYGSAAAVAAALPAPAIGQGAWPNKPIRIICGYPAGGLTDTFARAYGEYIAQKTGQPVSVENKSGASGAIAAEQVKSAPPDGYTLMWTISTTMIMNKVLFKKLPYDPDKAFAPISLVAELPLAMMVNPQVPAKTAKEFVVLAKGQPGKLSYSSSGAGGAPHLAAEMFKLGTGTFIVHVPYRGGGPAVQDLIAGHVQLSFMTVLEASGHLKAGKLRALAVTSAQRVAALPDVPTLAESAVPGFDSISWIGLLAPAGTPREIVEKISADVREAVAADDVKGRLVELGAIPATNTPAQFTALIEKDRARYAKIIAERGITVD